MQRHLAPCLSPRKPPLTREIDPWPGALTGCQVFFIQVLMKRRRTAKDEYHHLYCSSRWLSIRKRQLDEEPLCRLCAEEGIVTPADTVDHLVNHKGDLVLFFDGKVQSLCKPCHDRHAQRRDRGVDITPTGLDGWPIHSLN